MDPSLRWGILGNATIARKCMIPALSKARNASVRALGSQSLSRASQTAQQFSIPALYGSYDEVLADPDVDAVYIALPNHLHHHWTLRCLASGKHVLCEKPLACNEAQAREMTAAAVSADKLLMEAFMYRFHPRTVRIEKLISSGTIGTPSLIRSSFCFRMDPALLEQERAPRLDPAMGGGCLLDVGCYSVSIARLLFGDEPGHVSAQAVCNTRGADIHCAGTMLFSGGALAVFEASFVCALQQTYAVMGSKGAVELPHNAFIPWENDACYTIRGLDDEQGREYTIPGADEYQLMVEHFGDVVLHKHPPACDAHDSVCNMRVLDALAEAARTGKTVPTG